MQWGARASRNGGSPMSRMLNALAAAVALAGGAFGYAALNPCSAPTEQARALGLPVGASDCAARAAAASAPSMPAPPAVAVAPAERREFVERLFVSGTLVPREEADVAARIDGLTIVELVAEDGDRVAAGQVLARLDRTQLDALLAENDAAITRADAAIDQSRSLITQQQAQVEWASSDFARAQKLGGG